MASTKAPATLAQQQPQHAPDYSSFPVGVPLDRAERERLKAHAEHPRGSGAIDAPAP